MPSPESSTSTALLKAARTGTAKSRPATPPAESDTSALDALFEAERRAGTSAEPAPEQIVVGAGIAPDVDPPLPAPPAAAAGSGAGSGADPFARMQRFSAAKGQAEPAAAGRASERSRGTATVSTGQGGAASAPAGASVMDRVLKLSEDGGASLKKAMAGAKVLTPLVAAVAFAPGTGSAAGDRRAALTATLLATHRVVDAAAGAFESAEGKSVPQWIRTQLMIAAGEQIAKRIERQRTQLSEVEVQRFADALSLVSREHAGVLAEVVDSACNDAYRACETKADARGRLAVTLASCAWKMHDWVTHDCLAMDPKGEHPSRFFSYGLEIDRIVQDLLRAAVDQASTFVVNPDDMDLRIAHLQNSINRFTNLIGAEYVTRTRATMNWIGEDGLTPQDALARSRQACERFLVETLPRILEHVRSTFAYIENGAAQIADGFYETLLNEPINVQSQAR